MTPDEMIQAMRSLSNQRREAQKWLEDAGKETAEAERTYRKARAVAWVSNPDGTAGFREAHVDADTADLRFQRDLSERMEKAALEKVRGVRQEMSLLQTYMAYERGVAELHRFDEATQ